jgi:hypothetical protein
MRKIIYQNILVFFVYFFLFEIQEQTFFLAQQNILQQNQMIIGAASLIFIPHGVRVLSYIFFGPKIFFGLFLAHVVSGLNFTNEINTLIIPALFSTICALIAIKMYTGDFVLKDLNKLNAKFIFYISILSALFNSLTVNTYKLLTGVEFGEAYGSQLIQYIIGDLIGTFVLFYIFIFVRKIIRQSFY